MIVSLVGKAPAFRRPTTVNIVLSGQQSNYPVGSDISQACGTTIGNTPQLSVLDDESAKLTAAAIGRPTRILTIFYGRDNSHFPQLSSCEISSTLHFMRNHAEPILHCL